MRRLLSPLPQTIQLPEQTVSRAKQMGHLPHRFTQHAPRFVDLLRRSVEHPRWSIGDPVEVRVDLEKVDEP
jgi:hypothetical protein